MTTLFKRPSSPNFYGRFQHNGRDICFSTRTSNRKEAEKALRERLAQVKDDVPINAAFEGLKVRLEAIADPEARDRKRREFAEELMQDSCTKVNINTTWQTWLDSPRKRDPGVRTLRAYNGQWRRFEDWLATEHPKVNYLHEVRDSVAESYAADLWRSNVTGRTFNAHLIFLRSMFRTLKTAAGLTTNPWTDIPTQTAESESRKPFTLEELDRVCSTAPGNLRILFALGVYCGLRLADTVLLKWNEVDLEGEMIERVPRKTKRLNRAVRFPIHPTLLAILKEHRRTSKNKSEYLFPADAKIYLRDDSQISKQVQRHLEDSGLKTTEAASNGHRKTRIVRYGFHSLRFSFVSLCAARGIPLTVVQAIVGHSSVRMTSHYSYADPGQKKQAIASLPEVSFNKK